MSSPATKRERGRRSPTQLCAELARRLGVILAITYLLLAFALFFGQRRLIFFPNHDVSLAPDYFKVSYEDVYIPVQDAKGGNVNAWWAPAETPDAIAVIMFHGNAETISGLAKQTQRFHQLGCGALVVEYRGYGKSSGGFPSESSVYADAEAGWNYLTNGRGFRPKGIYIFGHSLGGAVAIDLAARHPDAGGVILESTLTSVADVGGRVSLFRIFPLRLLVTQRFDSLDKARTLKIPALVIHGDADPVIPFAIGRKLYVALPQPKRFLSVPGGDHDHIAEIGGETYMQAMRDFLR